MTVDGILAATTRVASIESRLGVRPPLGTDSRPTVDFASVLAAYTTTPASSATAPGQPAASVGSLDTVPFAALFRAAGQRYGVDPALLAAVAGAESGYEPSAVSRAGAQGLMQLMPGTAAGLGVTDPFDPAQAIDGAARLLAGHLDRFGSTELAVAAYNAGAGAVDRYGGIPPFEETRRYVPEVLRRYQELSR